MASEQAGQILSMLQKDAVRLVWLLRRTEGWFMGSPAEGTQLKSITVRPAAGGRGGCLVIARAKIEGRSVVGFHSGDTADAALKGALERIENTSMEWKDDKFADD
jgi:hypothetical protein